MYQVCTYSQGLNFWLSKQFAPTRSPQGKIILTHSLDEKQARKNKASFIICMEYKFLKLLSFIRIAQYLQKSWIAMEIQWYVGMTRRTGGRAAPRQLKDKRYLRPQKKRNCGKLFKRILLGFLDNKRRGKMSRNPLKSIRQELVHYNDSWLSAYPNVHFDWRSYLDE